MNQIPLAKYRQQIEDAMAAGDYEEAIAHSRHILEWYPHHVEAYWLLGSAMLEAGRDDQAIDMFQRALSADPEHVRAWIGISETAKRRGDMKDALWSLQRAFELATDSKAVAEKLRQLYRELEGDEPSQLSLTESGMARLYLRGNLLKRAIHELGQLIEEHPDRLDLRVALAEAFWRDGQHLQASQICQEILEEQPYVLKANLILGEIWYRSGRTAEGELCLDRAEAVDPENQAAQDLFGAASTLARQEPQIEPITYEPREQPADGLDPHVASSPEDDRRATEAEEGAIPGHQEPIEESMPETSSPLEPTKKPAEEPSLTEAASGASEERDILDWLRDLEKEEFSRTSAVEVEPENIPDWLREPDDMADEERSVRETALEGSEPSEIPDWLQGLIPPTTERLKEAPAETAAPRVEEDGLSQEAMPEDVGSQTLEKELALEELGEMAEASTWAKEEELPAGDEALAWLARLAEGDEEELQPPAQPESVPFPTEETPEVARSVQGEAPSTKEPETTPELAVRADRDGEPPPSAPQEEEAREEPAALEGEALAEVRVEPTPEQEISAVEGRVAEDKAIEATEDPERIVRTQRAYAADHPEDAAGQLELGRVLWQADERGDAIATYDALIARRALLEEVIADLEDYIDHWPDARVMQSLGDAYMQNDQLQDALDTYREALASL